MLPATDNVLPFRRMLAADYERERALLRETYGESSIEAAAKRDQALAKLFYRCQWTQEELAKVEQKTQPWITRRILFGRFLNFMPMGINPETAPFTIPSNLTERRFRGYWQRTDKSQTNDRQRFLAVARLMQEETILMQKRRPLIGKEIKAAFADGEWHPINAIISKLDAPEEHIRETLERMRKDGHYGVKCERKKVGTSSSYRIFRQTRTISSAELKTKLTPLVEGLKAEGRKNMATMSTATVAHLAGSLQKLLDEWTE